MNAELPIKVAVNGCSRSDVGQRVVALVIQDNSLELVCALREQ